MKSYKDLEIYQLAFKYAIEVHHLSLKLPKYELYEQGSQVRRSSKSVKDTIVEGYGRRVYKREFIRYLIFSHASLLECIAQLETIEVTHLDYQEEAKELVKKYNNLGKKIHNFKNYVEKSWKV
jgi:four helix bundle protein